MSHVIRLATPEDTTLISMFITNLTGKAIFPLHIENRLHFMRNHPNEMLYVYEENKQILGTLGFRIRPEEGTDVKISEVSIISFDETNGSTDPSDKLKQYAEELASKHACTGIWWIAGSEQKNGTHASNQTLRHQETGYRFVKRFL
ncbi:GNAT family N-acetyltransferase [Paenibacillus sp. SI8]|uniref:GNAT family N-acetyltransferase n=1 Tax=unclassified Paenibacillus TaxID=185978 RepID=UPI0034652285